MAVFPLVGLLPPSLLERTISKFERKSYFRLQQTCKTMEELVQTSENIGIFWNQYFYPKWEQQPGGSVQLQIQDCGRPIRCRRIEQEFDYFCDMLEKHRITCSYVHTYNKIQLTKEQCARLINILKPINVYITIWGSDRYESLLYSTTLKHVSLRLDYEDAICVAMELLSLYESVDIQLVETTNFLWNEFYMLFHFILVCLESLPNLHRLQLFAIDNKVMPSAEEILENFREFQPTVVYKNRDFALKFKTRQGGYSCTVVVNFVAHFRLLTRITFYMNTPNKLFYV